MFHWLEGVKNSSKSRTFGTVTTHQSIPAVPLPHSRSISRLEHLKKIGKFPGMGTKQMPHPRVQQENNSYKFNKSSLFCMPEPVQKVGCYYSKKSLRSNLILHIFLWCSIHKYFLRLCSNQSSYFECEICAHWIIICRHIFIGCFHTRDRYICHNVKTDCCLF